MKYTNIYTHLIFLLTFEQIACSKSFSDKPAPEVSADEAPPPPHQDIPRLITPKESESLLELIKADKHQNIVTFFNKNNLIDYPLIRFKSDDGVNGYTPLAAAIRYCSKDTAKVLVPIQFSYPWTVTIAPRHSLAELAAKYCPSLLIEAIDNRNKDHPLAPIVTEGMDLDIITQIAYIATDKNTKMSEEDYEKISDWFESLFQQDFDNQLDELIKEDSKEDVNTNEKPVKIYTDFKLLLKSWLKSGRDVKNLLSFLKKTDSTSVKALVAIELIKIGKTEKFLEIFEEIKFDENISDDTLRKAAVYITPDQLKSFDNKLKHKLSTIFSSLNVEIEFDYLKKSADLIVSQCPYMYTKLYKEYKSDEDPINLIMALLSTTKTSNAKKGISASDAIEATKACNKLVNSAYGDFIQRYPRIDTVINLFPLDHPDVKVIWVGNDKSIDTETDFHGFTKNLINAFIDDDSDALKDLFINQKWGKISFNELRINFPPYNLSLLKTAIMFKKTKVFNYIISLNDVSLHSTTKHQLTAIEMAACYQPEYLVDHILPHFSKSCNKRLRAANNLIAMFKESFFQKCPTGAKNASKILSALLNSKDENEISCIDFVTKDAVEEAFKYNYPDDLIKAFHNTGKYTKNEFYIFLAAKYGNINLFNYFISLKKPELPSKATEEALATWIRFTDGKYNNENVEVLEFFLKHKDVKLNAIMEDSGVSALSLASQRLFTWIVKRLLLEKDINVNITDMNTLTTPIQHSINVFRNVVPSNRDIPKIRMVRVFHKLARLMDFNYNYDQIEFGLNMLYKWLTKQKPIVNPTSDLAPIITFIMNYLTLDDRELADKNCYQAIPVFWRILNDLVNKLDMIKSMLNNANFKASIGPKFNKDAISFNYLKFSIVYSRDLLQKCLEKLTELQRFDKNDNSGQYSASSGLVHNVLLSHPAIDTTIENAGSIDTLYITKKRALYLVGDDDGFDEMTRTHVRVRNIDTVHNGKKNYKLIAFGVVSTLIVGAVSAGIIRLMI